MLYQCLLICLAIETFTKDWLRDEHRVMYGGAEPLHCTPETNIRLHINYTAIKKKTQDFWELKDTIHQVKKKHKIREIIWKPYI